MAAQIGGGAPVRISQENLINNNYKAPNDVWAYIFSFLTNPAVVRPVCRQWNKIVLDNPILNKQIFQRAFGCLPDPQKGPVEIQFRNAAFNFEKQVCHLQSSYFLNPDVNSPNEIDHLLSCDFLLAKTERLVLLHENSLLVCASPNLINRSFWDLSKDIPNLKEKSAFPNNMSTLLMISILSEPCHLLSATEVLFFDGNNCAVFDLQALGVRTLFRVKSEPGNTFSCIDIKENTNKVQFAALAFTDGSCEIRNLTTHQQVFDFQFEEVPSAICLDLKNCHLAIGTEEGIVEIWEIATDPREPRKRLISEKVFDHAIKFLSLQGNAIAVATHGEMSELDEIKLLHIHGLKRTRSISLPNIAAIDLQGTQLIVVHGHPLQIKRYDFSVNDEDFFQNIDLSNEPGHTYMLILKRFSQLDKTIQKEILQVYKNMHDLEDLGKDFCLENIENIEELLNAIRSYYFQKK